MDVILALIIKYLNGCMYNDATYRTLKWMLNHYMEMDDDSFNKENLMTEANVTEEDVNRVLTGLVQDTDFDKFKETLWQFQSIRLDQIRSRMIGVKEEDIISGMEKDCSDEEMKGILDRICDMMDKAHKIYLVGALYPMALSTEFQTDMNIFGKNVQQFHLFHSDIEFNEDDLVIFISTTGRSASYFVKAYSDKGLNSAKKVLITQNKQYLTDEQRISDETIIVPGRYDGININYQIMKIFDVLRLSYYQKYFL